MVQKNVFYSIFINYSSKFLRHNIYMKYGLSNQLGCLTMSLKLFILGPQAMQ